MTVFPVLLGAAVALAALHMVAPDHWVPLTVVSKRLEYSPARTYATAAAIGAVHAIISVGVAAVAFAAGIMLVRSYVSYLQTASAILLIAVGVYFIVNGYTEAAEGFDSASGSVRSVLAVSIFPDLALIPILLGGSSLPALQVSVIVLAFVLVSCASLTLMSFGTVAGFSKAVERMPPRYVDYVMGLILFATAAIMEFTVF